MTRSEALQRCVDLHAAGGDPAIRWIPRRLSADDWTVVRLRAPGLPRRVGALGTALRSAPRPPAPDPRPLLNPFWGGTG